MTFSPVQALCDPEDVVIANGASLSGGLNLNGRVLCGVYMPGAWTAAGLSFAACDTLAGTYEAIQTATAEYVATAAASQYVALDPVVFYGVRFIKVRSGTVALAVNQGAARTLTLMCAVPSRSQ